MGYRDQFAVVEKTKREKIPRPAEGETKPRPPSTLSQHSMKGLNVLIGGLTPGDPEHGLLPILKLIDFGRGEEIDPKEDPSYGDQIGVSSNLDGVAFVSSIQPVKTLASESRKNGMADERGRDCSASHLYR